MTTYVIRNGQLVEKHLAEPLHLQDEATSVITDTMDHTRHMADGKYYDSKSLYRQVTKQHNCVEVGNETKALYSQFKPRSLDRRQRRDDIAKAIHEVRNGSGVKLDKTTGRIISGMSND